ncbi:MAG: hypothetical protein KFF73_02415 [Cyclobacteriaceae bacterium]|nr:hypothetical protein [Cyclobacteriaceae bacterium]
MRKSINNLFLFGLLVLVYSCVDDYQDANPPRLLDSPAVTRVTASDSEILEGESTTITATVVDAPAGVDSVAITATNEDGDPVGSYTLNTPLTGQTQGDIEITYTAPLKFMGIVAVSVTVYDKQFDEKGEVVRKSSVPKSAEVEVICTLPLNGTYEVTGQFLQDDFGSPDVVLDQEVINTDCISSYLVEDLSGGLYTGTYADNYGTDPVEAEINIDPDTNLVTWENVSDQFGGEVLQDDAQPDSFFDPDTNTITIYWTATSYGERGISTFVKK